MKKVLSLLLTVVLICQLAIPAFADTGYTIGNTTEKNRTIFEKLQSLCGDDLTEDDIINELSNMGLLDREGNLNVSESIMVDGTPMTLEQVKAMLNKDDIDLSKKVSVDGTELTLGDLKIMIEIEEELARIKKMYFTCAMPFTEEHYESYDSLLSQIESEGIMLESNMPAAEGTPESETLAAKSTEAAINHDARIELLSCEDINRPGESPFGGEPISPMNLRYKLADKNVGSLLDGLDYDAGFSWRILDGSAKKEINVRDGYRIYQGTETISKGTYLSSLKNGGFSIRFPYPYGVDPLLRWNGDKVFIIQLYDPVNILFDNGKRTKDIVVALKCQDHWDVGGIVDTFAPTIDNVIISDGSYYSGQAIPIAVEFSELVRFEELRMLLINGKGESIELAPVESPATISKCATFLYTVPKKVGKNEKLQINCSLSNIKDIKGNTTNLFSWPDENFTQTFDKIIMNPDPLLAFKDLKLYKVADDGSYYEVPDGSLYGPDDEIIVRLDVDQDVSEWFEDDYNLEEGRLNTVCLKAGDNIYPLAMGGEGALEGSFYTASIPAANYADKAQQILTVELYSNDTDYFESETLIVGIYAKANIAPLALVESITINESSYAKDNIIYLTDKKSTRLTVSVNPADKLFIIKWESSDPNIADIDEEGVITPRTEGKVKFRAYADNGSFGLIYSDYTDEFTIAGGGPPTIVFPEGNNAFVTRKNEAVNIVWNQNLIGRTIDVDAVFDIEVYEGYFSNPVEVSGTPVHTQTVNNENKYIIPANILEKVSKGTEPAYTVKVNAVNPDNASETLSAIGYIIVYPLPARVKFDKLGSYYITDEVTSIEIDWTLMEFTDGEFELKIVKNQDAIYTDTRSKGRNGSYTLNTSSVADTSLKDIYVVSIKAKNYQDSGWSTDSFALHVYNRNSINILVDDEDQSQVTMDNNDYIKSLYNREGSSGILGLNRKINLKEFIGINYDEYPWGNITDQIKWTSSDSGVASVNYSPGTIYENVEKLDYTSYRPSTKFMLAGNSDGAAVITATHAATGMQDKLDVNVKTLKDKLYIFNFYPKQETKITYINGNGEVRNLISDAQGQIAIYEEEGIASDITLKSGSNNNLYLGTLYNNKLLSSEKDPGVYELYPVNTFSLRPAAKVELFFKNSDGKPYTGKVIYRGAVYKNGNLCNETIEKAGKLLTIGLDGRFTLNLDSTKFWVDISSEELSGSDKLEFIYEIIFEDDYYPQLVTVNGNLSVDDLVRFGESVVNLKPVSTRDKNKPFIVSQSVNYSLENGRVIDLTNYKRSIGPSNMYPSADLETIVSWWGCNKEDGYDLKVEDEYGSVIKAQKVKTILYPFALLAYSKNITTLGEASLNLDTGHKKGAALSFYSPDGSLLKHVESPFTFANMVGAPALNDSKKGVNNELKEIKDYINKLDTSSFKTNDKIIDLVLTKINGKDIGTFGMNLHVAATEDPFIYKGLITHKMSFSNESMDSIEIEHGDMDAEINYKPSLFEALDLGKIKSEGLKKFLEDNVPTSAMDLVSYGASLKGYFEVEIHYDTEAGKWKIIVIGGGFDFASLVGISMSMNNSLLGIPVTAEFGAGALAEIEFRAVKPYGNVPAHINAADVNDFFSVMRVTLYIKAFGGLGFDYSVIALKIGVFGQLDLIYNGEFLNRPYLHPHPYGYDKIYATTLKAEGQVGIKFAAKFLFLSYEAVIASGSFSKDIWTEGNPGMIDEWKRSKNSMMLSAERHLANISNFNIPTVGVVSEKVALESRDYLGRYERRWGGNNNFRLLGSLNSMDIQTNAYPYANPLITRDGEILAYLSDGNTTDVNDTCASWAIKEGSGYRDKGALPSISPFADNNLKLDGTGSFAVAAWEKQRMEINTQGTLDLEGLAAMLNNSEIVASVYDGDKWITTTLTDNLVPDLSPVVAAKGGHAIVVWRSVAGSNMSGNPLNYNDVNDSIVYKEYISGEWGETKTLYNGTSGNVKGISASIMSGGNAAIAYALDSGTGDTGLGNSNEIYCVIIDSRGDLKTDLRLTNNNELDENPQITTVNFGTEEGERFVIGWHNIAMSGASDIRLAAIDNEGRLDDSFIDSISNINENASLNITNSFRFAKGENINLTDLSLLWVTPSLEYNAELGANANKECLKAAKFMRDSQGRIYISAVLDVADMNQYTQIDHFDAYTSGNNAVNAVLLSSSYTGELIPEGFDVYTIDPICSMKSVSAVYENDLMVKGVYVNYGEIKNNFKTSIQFTIANMGITPIDSVKITLKPDNVTKTFDGLNILPNQSHVFIIDYDVPGVETGIHDLDYMVTATFSNNDEVEKSGVLDIDVPDTGISKVELISDEQGKRVIQATLQNLSHVPLYGSTNRKVYVGFYTSSEFIDGTKVGVEEITGQDVLLLDKSALTIRFTYNVPTGGIPKGGTRLYGRIWTEEQQKDGTFEEIIEYYQNNNVRSILLPNPIEANNGDQFLVTVEQENDLHNTTAFVTVKNLSMERSANGNVIAYLLDEKGNAIETKLFATTIDDLLTLDGEKSVTKEIIFTQLGTKVIAKYFTADPTAIDVGISDISLLGIKMNFDSTIINYSLTAENIGYTTVLATAKKLGDTVEIRSADGKTLLASGAGAVPFTLQLPIGNTSFQILAPAAETWVTPKTYSISITNTTVSSGTVNLIVSKSESKMATVTVSANDLQGFVPIKWQYSKNGQWSNMLDWSVSQQNIFNISGIGTYYIQARLWDKNGYYMDSNPMTIKVQDSSSKDDDGIEPPSNDNTNNQKTNIIEQTANTITISVNANIINNIYRAEIDEIIDEAISKAIELESLGQKVVIEIDIKSTEGVKEVELLILEDALKRLKDLKNAELRINTGISTITFDAKTLNSIIHSATSDLIFGVKIVDKTILSKDLQDKIGDRPVYAFGLLSDGKAITSFSGGKVSISIPYKPKANEKHDSIVVYYIDSEGKLKNVMGRYNPANGTVDFKTTHFSKYVVGYKEVKFLDVNANDWFNEAVSFLSARNIVNGVGAGKFAPGAKVTRADFLVMVMNAYGIEPTQSIVDNFADAGSKYYTPYLATAKSHGLVVGAGNNCYFPEKQISRQDMTVILLRILDNIGELPTGKGGKNLARFKDKGEISDYAHEAMEVFVQSGILSGFENKLRPKYESTRAQAAQMLYNLLKQKY